MTATPPDKPVIVTTEASSPQGITSDDLRLLELRLKRGDRAGVYADLYRLTGQDIWLMHAQITSYSGLFGGAALGGNYRAKLVNPRSYNVALDVFSREIAASMLNVVRTHVANGNNGMASIDALRTDGDRKVWADKGMGEDFPGNILFGQVWNHRLCQSYQIGISRGSLHGVLAGLYDASNGKRPSEFASSTIYRTVASSRFVTVIDTRDNKIEVFWDKKAGLGPTSQIKDVALTRRDLAWHVRTGLWEFLQANQDEEQQMDPRLVRNDGKALPNPNIPGVFEDLHIPDIQARIVYRDPLDRKWHWAIDPWFSSSSAGMVGSPGAIAALEKARDAALDFRRRHLLPLEPPIPRRYVHAGLWPVF
jgi:hypothetical protein